MATIVVYPGRFHPFHRGHFGVYKQLAQQWGADNVYVATSEKQAPITSPFTFGDKQDMMIKLGVPGSRIVKVKNPYQAAEVTKDYNPESDRLIFALGAKDAERISFAPKKDGSASYMQPMPKNPKEMKPFGEHAYVTVVPTVTFRVAGADANSATQIRERYIKGNNALRDQIILDLYGDVDSKIRSIFDARLDTVKEVTEFVYEQRRQPSQRGVALVERILRLERAIDDKTIMEFAPEGFEQYRLWTGDGVQRHLVGKFSSIDDATDEVEFIWSADPRTRLVVWLVTDLNDNTVWYYDPQDEADKPRWGFIESPDYIEEKWSEKYKRSINCSNPRGFSQRAHCQGRKKK